MNQKLAVNEAVNEIEKQRDALKHDLDQAELEKQVAEKALTDKYEIRLKDRDEIERLKTSKPLSTKMVGETLERHCRPSSISSGRPRSRGPTLRRTTTPAPAARRLYFGKDESKPRLFPHVRDEERAIPPPRKRTKTFSRARQRPE